jgi:hypothetical protein
VVQQGLVFRRIGNRLVLVLQGPVGGKAVDRLGEGELQEQLCPQFIQPRVHQLLVQFSHLGVPLRLETPRSLRPGRRSLFLEGTRGGSLFHDEDGRSWVLTNVMDWRPGHHAFAGIVLQELDTEWMRLLGEPKVIFEGTSVRVTEAPHLYRENGWYYRIPVLRVRGMLSAAFDLTEHLELVGGAGYARNRGRIRGDAEPDFTLADGGTEVVYYSVDAFAEALIKTRLADLTAGVRFEHHDTFGAVVVPRAAVTRSIGDLHVKGLAARAFRVPTV